MGKKGDGQVQETAQQAAAAQIGAQQLQDWKQRWSPVLQRFAANTETAGMADSQQRRAATAKTGVDTSAQFGMANEKALGAAGATGTLGSAKQKLALTGMGNDQATSTAFGSVAADQAVDDSTVQGLKAVTSLARGEKADTIDAIGRNAAISGQQAAADAAASLEDKIGAAQFAGQAAGTGLGLWMGNRKAPGVLPGGVGSAPY